MQAGNAIERAYKNIAEMANFMLKELHFPYILFLEGSNFLTQTISVKRPDGRVVILEYNLARWRETLPDLPSLNFDENPSESFQEIKDLAPSVYRKLLDNDGIFNLVLILFPEQKVLKMLVEYLNNRIKRFISN